MSVAVTEINELRNFSEIEFLLNSDLLDSSWGIRKLLQRLALFPAHKRHIPFLLLIHLVLYNREFPKKEKQEIIDLLMDSLYRDLLKKRTKNQLVDFFPKYYLVRILFDLYNSGYKIDKIIKGLKNEYLPLLDLITYGDASRQGFPQALINFRRKLTATTYFRENYYRYKDQANIVSAAIKAYNVEAYHELLPLVADKRLKNSLIKTAILVFAEHREIEKALILAGQDRMKDSRSGSYLDIALTLSRIGKIDTLHELTKAVLDPELSISIICGILDYYSGLDARAIVVKLINDAIVVLKNIGNYLLRSWRTCFLLLIAHRIGDNVLVESLIDDIKIYDNWINEKEPEENNHLRDYFFRVLIAIGRQEQAMEYIKKWESYSRDSDDEFFKFHNLNVRIQVIVEKELNAIEYKIRLDRLYSNHGAENADTKYFLIVLQMAEMIPGNTYKEESLNAIAKRMAKLGFYEDALKIKTMIEHENFNNEIDFAVCLSAVTNGHVTEAMKYASVIHDENTKYSIQLCMAPGLSQLNFRQEAESFVKQWGSFIFSIS